MINGIRLIYKLFVSLLRIHARINLKGCRNVSVAELSAFSAATARYCNELSNYRVVNIFAFSSKEEGFTYVIPEIVYYGGDNLISTKIGGQSYHEKILGVIFILAGDPKALSEAIFFAVKK